MPLEHLIRTINDQFMAESALERPPLSFDGQTVQGHYGGALLVSTLRPVRRSHSLSSVFGHDTAPSAQNVQAERGLIFQGDASLIRLVRLDRLLRTVHMLNALLQAVTDGFLFLKVHPQHLLGVKKDHGAYFEEIIHRCGLPLSRAVIVLSLQTRDAGTFPVLFDRFKGYRDRGYSTAIDLDQNLNSPLIDQFRRGFLHQIRPNHLRLQGVTLLQSARASDHPLHSLISAAREQNTCIHIGGLNTPSLWKHALDLGIDTVEGSFVESLIKNPETRPTRPRSLS